MVSYAEPDDHDEDEEEEDEDGGDEIIVLNQTDADGDAKEETPRKRPRWV